MSGHKRLSNQADFGSFLPPMNDFSEYQNTFVGKAHTRMAGRHHQAGLTISAMHPSEAQLDNLHQDTYDHMKEPSIRVRYSWKEIF